jgi:hypothetical protein
MDLRAAAPGASRKSRNRRDGDKADLLLTRAPAADTVVSERRAMIRQRDILGLRLLALLLR